MLIKFGSIVTDGRGKLGGQVYSKNRAGSYVRNNAIPSNPRTSHQMKSRALLGSLSQDWGELTESQRQAWESATDDFKKTNIFGDQVKLSGKNLFTSLNKNLLQVEKSALELPPSPDESASPIKITAAYSDSENQLAVSTKFEDSSGTAVIRATPPVSMGTNFVKNRLRVVDFEEISNEVEEFEIMEAYEERFGSIPEGKKIFVGVYVVGDNGVRTPEMTTVVAQ